jgi:hypothetical protein
MREIPRKHLISGYWDDRRDDLALRAMPMARCVRRRTLLGPRVRRGRGMRGGDGV